MLASPRRFHKMLLRQKLDSRILFCAHRKDSLTCRPRFVITSSISCSAAGRAAGTGPAATPARVSTCGRTVIEHQRHWEVPGLIASLDAGIAPRLLLARHPATGWCRSCRTTAPCSVRQLAEAAGGVGPG